MQKRAVQQGFAMGFAGVLGVMMVPGSASGGAAPLEPEGVAGAALLKPLAGRTTILTEAAEGEGGLLSPTDEAAPMGDKVSPKFECGDPPYKCPYTTRCVFPSMSINCVVIDCGDGKCPTCPSVVSKILIKGWCSYGCAKDAKTVGGALIFKPAVGNDDISNAIPFCIDQEGKVYRDGKLIL